MEIPVQPANHSGKLALLLKYPCWEKGKRRWRRGGRKGGRREGKGGRRKEEKEKSKAGRGRTQVNFIRASLSEKHKQPSFTQWDFFLKIFKCFEWTLDRE